MLTYGSIHCNSLGLFIWFVGSRNTKVNMEARVVNSGSATRKCIVTKLNEFSLAAYHHLVESNAGAIMILLPSDLDQLSADEQEVDH